MNSDCPKCGGEMVEGYTCAPSPVYLITTWIAGQPKKNHWPVGKAPSAEQITIRAYRCGGCGFIELYAPAD